MPQKNQGMPTVYRFFWQHIGGYFVESKNYHSCPQRTAHIGEQYAQFRRNHRRYDCSRMAVRW